MAGLRGRRLSRVALTGVLAPGLALGVAGAVGLGALPGALISSAAAESVVAGGPCTAFGSTTGRAASELSVADVAEQLNPAVVTIMNLQPFSQVNASGMPGVDGIPSFPEIPNPGEHPSDTPGTTPEIELPADDTLVPVGTGSGFIVDEQGHVVTNAHVVDGAEALNVVLADGTEVPATVVGSEPFLDVAVLQLDLAAGQPVPGIAAFGDSENLRAGDRIVAIGNALGEFPNTVSDGTVNGTNRSFPRAGGLSDMIQHDAEIWHGNSGGPLLNLYGEVVGVNTAGIGSTVLGADTGSADMAFAIEGNTVCKTAAQLIESGEINWPYLGIQGEATSTGQEVVEVVEGGPSAEAGLQVGDIITAFDGQQIDRQHSLLDLLFERSPDDVVEVAVERDGAIQQFQVTLGERPESTD